MARLKRKSAVLETARRRLAGLKSITLKPDFGPNLSLDDYEKEINDFSAMIDEYNGKLAGLDDFQNRLIAVESNLRTKNSRMLSATEAQYGPDSSEYEQVGGVRRSERKKSPPKGKQGKGEA